MASPSPAFAPRPTTKAGPSDLEALYPSPYKTPYTTPYTVAYSSSFVALFASQPLGLTSTRAARLSLEEGPLRRFQSLPGSLSPPSRWPPPAAPLPHSHSSPSLAPRAPAPKPEPQPEPEGGLVIPTDVGFEGESQWLEFIPEHGGLGVRARMPIPMGRYIAKLREFELVEGEAGRDYFTKVNDTAFVKGVSRAGYEHRRSLCNCKAFHIPETGTFLMARRDLMAGEVLSLYYGPQYWYEGKPFFNPPQGGRAQADMRLFPRGPREPPRDP